MMSKLRKQLKRKVFISTSFILFCLFISTISIAKKYEMTATQYPFVNIAKRIIAEFFNTAFQIYDPYKNHIKKTQTGLLNINTLPKTLITTKEQLQIFLKDRCSNCKILEYTNFPLIRSHYTFQYENFLDPNLLELKHRYHLDDIIKPGKTEFDQQILLGQWINSQWDYGNPKDIDFNFNSLDVIDRGRRGEMFSCSEYSIAYIQAALSLGFQARYVGLTNMVDKRGHAVSEVWSNQYDKWVVIDNSHNLIYKHHGIPLNAYEIHTLWCNNRWKEITVITTKPPREISDNKIGLIDYYQSFFVRMKNDWYSNRLPHWHPISNSIANSLEYIDSCSQDSVLIINETSHVSDLYWDINKVHINLLPIKINNNLTFQVYLDTETPNFNEFIISVNKHRIFSKDNIFQWTLKEGTNTLAVAVSNSLGRAGPFRRLTLEVDSKRALDFH